MSQLTLNRILLSCLSVLLISASFGADEAGDTSDLVFVEITPEFITNYDGGGRLKYLKTAVTLRVQFAVEDDVRHHLPYIRYKLVMLFTSQLEEDLTSTEGKDRLRRLALAEVRNALETLEGTNPETIVNLYFPSFVIQQ